MLNYKLIIMNWNIAKVRKITLAIVFILSSLCSFAQVKSSIDSTSIKIGEQIIYKIEVETDTTDLVVFPEGQTFLPLEVIDSYKIDTTKNDAKFELIKKYALTQFDSGSYTIPQQKIVIGTQIFLTDSIKVEVNTVVVDTTKQGLYDIKPILDVKKSSSKWWLYLLIILLVLGLIAFLLYWFIWREKPLTEEEKEAQLPPYERAKLALQRLDESNYLEQEEIKEYYSDLTGIIRTYLDEKVYDHSLESTTEELIVRLRLLRDGNQIDLDKDTIKNIESILRRADLVKFAKSKPNIELAKMDRNTIDLEIDHVKESLPEPTEEELLEDLKYQEESAAKNKRRKIIITAAIIGLLIVGTFSGFVIKYGFRYVKDSIFGDYTKELLETEEWVLSEYGAPGITVATPKVLERIDPEIPAELEGQIEVSQFSFGKLIDPIFISVKTTKYTPPQPDPNTPEEQAQEQPKPEEIVLLAQEAVLAQFEQIGVENIITKNDQYITPNAAQGLKTEGTADFPDDSNDKIEGEYIMLTFASENIMQQIVLKWNVDDPYAQELIDKIVSSVELIKLTEDDK